MKTRTRKHLAVSFALFSMPLYGALTDTVWKGASLANWNVAGNWTAGLPNTNTSKAVLDSSSGGGTPVLLNTTATIGGLTVAPGFTLTRSATDASNRTLTLAAATTAETYFSNGGSIISGGTSGIFTLNIHQNASTIVNGSLIEASAGTELRIRSDLNNNILVTNTGGTIRTAGNGILHLGTATTNPVSLTGGNLQNTAGTINQSRTSDLTDVILTNGGIYNVDTGGNAGNPWGLRLNGTTSFTNSGTLNIIRRFVDDGSSQGQSNTFNLNSADVTLTNSGTINIIASGNPFSGGGNASFSVSATSEITNTGTINLESRSTTQRAQLFIATDQTATFSGPGEIVMTVGPGGSVNQVVFTGGTNSTLVNSAGHTIRGAGQLGNNTVNTLTNAGIIHADSADHALTINPRGTGTAGLLTNTGTLHASAPGGLVLVDGTLDNSGTVRVDSGSSFTISGGAFTSTAGTVVVNGDLVSAVPVQLTAGSLMGIGTVIGNVVVGTQAAIAPGNSIGTLTVVGNLDIDGTLAIEVAKDMFGNVTFDVLNVTGEMDIANATLDIGNLAGSGYDWTIPYIIATYGSLAGSSFAAITGSPNVYNIDYNYLGGNQIAIYIPEPASACLLLLGTLALIRRKNR